MNVLERIKQVEDILKILKDDLGVSEQKLQVGQRWCVKFGTSEIVEVIKITGLSKKCVVMESCYENNIYKISDIDFIERKEG